MNTFTLAVAGIDVNNFGFTEALQVALIGMTVVLSELALIAVFIMLISKAVRSFEGKRGKNQPAESPVASAQAVPSPSAMQSSGELKLVGVDEPTAAVIMAIVSNQSGIPLNKLSFKSIKAI